MSFFEKKIPTVVGLLLLGIAVLATSYLVNTGVILFGGAAPTENPEDVRITNVSDTSFTLTYKTEAKVIGTLALQLSHNTQTVLDQRDQQSGTPQFYTVHSIAVNNLAPATTYHFSITSGTTTYQNNNSPFSATTGSSLTASPSATKPLTGTILDVSGNPAADTLVFVTTKDGQSLSTLTQNNGIYIIPLNALRTSDFSSFLPLSDTSILQLLATDGHDSSQVQVALPNASPVSLITLGNNYNFVTSIQPIASTAASLGFPEFPSSNLNATPIIITPKKDEGFTDSQPQLKGTALPNQPVMIQIHSDAVISATVETNAQGQWSFRPQTPLSPGQHIISITTKNAAGILQTIQQSFTVYASGSQVNQTATPSGQLSTTPSPIPTVGITITPIPTVFLQTTTVPTPTVAPRPRPTLPPTGSNALIVSSVLGLVTTLTGVVLFVLTKGAM